MKACRVLFEKEIFPLLYGVPLTPKNLSRASEAIKTFFIRYNAEHLVSDLVFKTLYKPDKEGHMHEVESWLAYREGGCRLSHRDMANLIHRLDC